MSNYCGKKIFSDELYKFLNIKKEPYYLNYIYNAFFEKIKNTKSWNSYKLDDQTKSLLQLDWGSYFKISIIKKHIKEYHVISAQIPSEIRCYKQDFEGNHVQEICI